MHHTSSPQSGVIVTGGASGIGMACAEALAATGRPVAVWDLHEEAALRVARDIGQRFDVATTGIGIDLRATDAIDAAVRAGHLPAQDTALAATALLGALHESLVGPLAPENLDDPAKLRDAVQTVTLLALRAVGVMDARARGLVVQAVLPGKALVGA